MSDCLQCGRFVLDLSRPRIMGIVNLTRDSFSGDGVGGDVAAAVDRAQQLAEEGADLVDIGAESTRPGARAVDPRVEAERVVSVVRALAGLGIPISVDTRHAAVMREALAAGADMINDVGALGDPGALAVVADSAAAVCLMHMQGEPGSMQQDPRYCDVVGEVRNFLAHRADAARRAGVAAQRIVLDPGIGFGKTLAHNLALMRGLDTLRRTGYPLLLGVSRKSLIGAVTGRPVGERLAGSIAAGLFGASRGAGILRVHDVRHTRDALTMWQALEGGEDVKKVFRH